MDERSQSHATWDCKYHVVFASKYRRKGFTAICAVSWVIFCIGLRCKRGAGSRKGKTALYAANKYARKRRYKGYQFWAREYFVSTSGYDEQVVRRYIRNQEKVDKASDSADLFNRSY